MKHLQVIHDQALTAARRFHQAESDLIEALIEVEKSQVFVELGYSSLYRYATEALKLSESLAYSAITVARKARRIPELRQELAAQSISLSKAKKISSVLSPDSLDWLEKAKTLTSRELEKEVAKVSPRAVQEKAQYVSEKRLELQLGISEELFHQLQAVQDLVSQKTQKAATLEETLQTITEFYLSKKQQPSKSLKTQFPSPVPSSHCQYQGPEGKLCQATRWLDTHHIQPRSQGGSDDPKNLITLCKIHHRHVHRHP